MVPIAVYVKIRLLPYHNKGQSAGVPLPHTKGQCCLVSVLPPPCPVGSPQLLQPGYHLWIHWSWHPRRCQMEMNCESEKGTQISKGLNGADWKRVEAEGQIPRWWVFLLLNPCQGVYVWLEEGTQSGGLEGEEKECALWNLCHTAEVGCYHLTVSAGDPV